GGPFTRGVRSYAVTDFVGVRCGGALRRRVQPVLVRAGQGQVHHQGSDGEGAQGRSAAVQEGRGREADQGRSDPARRILQGDERQQAAQGRREELGRQDEGTGVGRRARRQGRQGLFGQVQGCRELQGLPRSAQGQVTRSAQAMTTPTARRDTGG